MFAATFAAPQQAQAQDSACLVWDPGTSTWEPDPGLNTDLGQEDGLDNTTCWNEASAYGFTNNASGNTSSAIGARNEATALNSSAIGRGNVAHGEASSALGYQNEALVLGTAAVGHWNIARGEYSAAVGVLNDANGEGSSAIGFANTADGDESSAFGYRSSTTATGATAIGHRAVGDREYAVSVGATGEERNIIHVADATQATDATNLRQLTTARDLVSTTMRDWIGGGATYAAGVFTAPSFTISGTAYSNVGSAFDAIDTQMGQLATSISNIALTPGPQGPTGPVGPQGPQGGGADPLALVYGDASRDTLTLDGADGTQISNVAAGVAATDAVNLGQMQAGDTQVLATAQTYADAGDTRVLTTAQTYADAGDAWTLSAANDYTDTRFNSLNTRFDDLERGLNIRFDQIDRRMDRLGAMSASQMQVAMNAAGGPVGEGRMAVGLGFQNGEEALSIGYARRNGARVSVSAGATFGRGGERSGGVGVGFKLF